MPAEGVRRPAWAEISHSALVHNAAALKVVLGETRLCAVVKANGYGHGALIAARAAIEGGAHWLAVALVDEGIELREAGVTAPILLLAEIPADTLGDALHHDLTVTIGSLDGARAMVRCVRERTTRHRVHLKVDTGMHRMGVAPEEVNEVVDLLTSERGVDLEGLYTHCSVADGSSGDDRQYTREQLRRFDEVLEQLRRRGVAPRLVHAANSAAALGYPESRHAMARVGLALYGYLPDDWLGAALEAAGVTLRPALTLRARVSALRRLDVGERPSYGRRRALERPATIATVPFGYADGFPRRLFDAGAEVLLRGRRYPLAGQVTMDQLLIDVGDEAVTPGEDVVLLGAQGDQVISADEWARRAETITWEILCGVSARVPRVVVA